MVKRFKWFVRRVFGVVFMTPIMPLMIVIDWVNEEDSTFSNAAKKTWAEYKEFALGIPREETI